MMYGALGLMVALLAQPFPAYADVCGRSAQMKQALEAATGRSCADLADEDLGQIEGLSFARQAEPLHLLSSDFVGLTGLSVLDLDGTSLRQVPADLLKNVRQLRFLYLGSTDLTELPSGFLEGLTSLKVLDLENTPLRGLNAGDVKDLGGLDVLTLADSQLASIETGTFAPFQLAWGIDLAHTVHLTSVPSGLFNGLPNLDRVYFSRSGMTLFPNELFKGDTSLELVAASSIPATKVPPSLFQGLSSLQLLLLFSDKLDPDNARELKAELGDKVGL